MRFLPLLLAISLACPILSPAASPAILPDPPPPLPYGFNPWLDIPLAGGILAMRSQSGAMLKNTRSVPIDAAALDARSVPTYDRWAIGLHSSVLSSLSSGLAWSEYLIPLSINAWDTYRGRQPWYGALTDALILQEALMLSTSLSSYAKSYRIHSTPLSYDPGVGMAEKRIPQNASSFFSNHTATAFTAAVFSGYTFQLRHPESPLVPWIWGTSLAMASGVGALRILAGKHFPSDVAAGAAVGALSGYLLPRLHLRTPRSRGVKRGKSVDLSLSMEFPGGSTTPAPTLNVAF